MTNLPPFVNLIVDNTWICSSSGARYQDPQNRPVLMHRQAGVRSTDAIRRLQQKFGFGNLYNLKGGILAWANEVDADMARY